MSFSDDTAFLNSSYRPDTIKNRLLIALKQIYKYYENWKIKLNESKTQAILFTKRCPENAPEIVFNNWHIKC